MKWVKATERLPEKKGKYCIKDHRYNGENNTAFFSESHNSKRNSLFYTCPDKIEWLDETEETA